MAIRASMALTKNPGGVIIEDHKTTYHLNPSVGNIPWVEDSIAPHSTAWRKSSMKDYVPEVEEIVSTLSSSPSLHGMNDAYQF